MAEGPRPGPATATVSSLKSEDSTEQLICKTPQKLKNKSVCSKSVEAGSDDGGKRRLVVLLGLAQVVLGALLVSAGAGAVVKGAALSRVGAGLWAGCAAVVTGVVGVLAGINDCYGLNTSPDGSSPLLTAFLALSLLCLACGNSAAVLAATGLQRDAARAPVAPATFEDEMEAWTPVLANIAVLIIATVHCIVCVASICHLSKRVCPCFRAKRPYDHNQFEAFKTAPYVVHLDEKKPHLEEKRSHTDEKPKAQELCKNLEGKLQQNLKKNKKDEPPEYGSANSKEKLVNHWLGRQQPGAPAQAGRARRPAGRMPQVMLLPAPPHAASTLGRMPVNMMLPPRYATLPLPPAHYPPPPGHLFYPLPDARIRRRRSPRERRAERRRRDDRERNSKLTRSLERIHRKRRVDRDRVTDAELKRTYTGLDRAYAEQFIAVCDESRHAAETHDSLGSTSASSDTVHSQITS